MGLPADQPSGDGDRLLVQEKFIRLGLTAHQVFAQAPDGADLEPVGVGPGRVHRVEDAAGPDLQHHDPGHAHEGVPVFQAVAQPVGDGPGGIFAGQDLLVGREQVVSGDVQFGGVLSGKGGLAVFPHGAAAHGQTHPGLGFGLQVPVGLENFRRQPRRHLGRQDQVPDNPAGLVQEFGRLRGEPAQALLNGPGQAGLLEKEMGGPGGDDETRRHRRPQKFPDEGEIRGLGPGHPDHLRPQDLQGQDQFPRRQRTSGGQNGGNLPVNPVNGPVKLLILPWDKAFKAAVKARVAARSSR